MNLGMTNTSNVITLDGHKYVIRMPGVGTSEMINREQEMEVYKLISPLKISDEVLYINKDGMKITRFIEDAKNCDAKSWFEVSLCMDFLRDNLHKKHLKCNHRFDLKERILHYRHLAGEESEYSDYEATERKVFKLLEWVDSLEKQECLTHIDANPDNFILTNVTHVTLLDWEYAAMQDPHVDIAMFAIYAGYTKEEIDTLINIYFEGDCSLTTRMKIYAYVAICGLLWSNWCEYKHQKGQTFGGDYEKSQYMYAVNYSNFVLRYLCSIGYDNDKTKHIKAIILAAGKGVRLGKLTESTPKPLLNIKGMKMIDSCIIALRNIGVQDIEVITGYHYECFEKLKELAFYKGIKFTYNQDYDKGNNILSLDKAQTSGDVIILDGDQVLDPTIFKSLDFSHSFYCNQYCDETTDSDWQIFDKNNVIYGINTTKCLKTGKKLRSISFWKEEDFVFLKSKIETEIDEDNIFVYWDNIALKLLPLFVLYTYQVSSEDAIEIDTYDDYQKYGGTLL